jgi:two-component system, response regulator YesN
MKSRIFVRYLLSYLMILSIPILIGSFAYNRALDLVEQDAIDLNTIIIEQGRDVVDTYLKEVDNTTKQLALGLTSNNITYSSGSVTAADVVKIMEVKRYLSSFILTNGFVKQYYIYFKNGDVVITPDTAYKDPALFYEQVLDDTGKGYAEWLESMTGVFHFRDHALQTIRTGQAEIPSIALMQSIPLTEISDPKGCIVMLIPHENFKKLLNPIYIKGGGWYYIADAEGRVILSSQPDPASVRPIDLKALDQNAVQHISVDDQDMIVSYAESRLNQWKYVAVLPSTVVLEKVDNIRQVIILVIILILILGILLSLIIAYRNYLPFRKLLRTITGNMNPKQGKDEFDTLKNAFSMLHEANESMSEAMERQKPLLQSVFLDRLLKGELNNIREIETYQTVTGIQIIAPHYIVLIFQFSQTVELLSSEIMEEMERKKVIASEVIRNVTEGTAILQQSFPQQIIAILPFTIADTIEQSIDRYVQNILLKLQSINLPTYVGIGSVCHHAAHIFRSCDEAREALDYGLTINQNVMDHRAVIMDKETCYFPLELQMKISNVIRSGEINELELLIQLVYQENFEKRKMTANMTRQLLWEMKGLSLKLRTQLVQDLTLQKEIIEGISRVPAESDSLTEFRQIAKILRALCNIVKMNKHSNRETMIDEIRHFIERQYSDPQLSLVMIAHEFGMNEAYLSYLFKERTGENISTYIIGLRVLKACELLSQGIPVTAIARHVGYYNDQSFRRAFKRVIGVSPSDYKNKQ